MKRLLILAGLTAFVLWVGAGCKSLPGNLEIDTPFIDIEYEGKNDAKHRHLFQRPLSNKYNNKDLLMRMLHRRRSLQTG